MTTLFPWTPPLAVDQYLMGSPRWSRPMSLVNARVICKAGSSTARTVLQMEVDGTLVDKRIPILPLAAGEEINFVCALNYLLPAGAELRFKCVQAPDGGDEAAVRELGLNLTAAPASADETPASDLYVRWVSGEENLRLFEYSADTRQFTESAPGLAAGRASIANGVGVGEAAAVIIDGATALTVDLSGVLQVHEFVATGGTAALSPRLEFWRDQTRLASLTKAGQLVVVDLVETEVALLGGNDRFELFGNGTRAAIVGPVSLTGLSFQEA